MGGDDEIRNQLMKNLFGGEEEDHSDHQSDEEGGQAEHDGGGKGEAEEHMDHEHGDSEGERVQSSLEEEVNDQQMDSESKVTDSEEVDGQWVVTSHKREVVASKLEGSEDDHHFLDHENEDDEFFQARKQRSFDEQNKDDALRNVFGDSDDEEDEHGAHNEQQLDSHRAPGEEDGIGYDEDLKTEDLVPDEGGQYELEKLPRQKLKKQLVGPPLELEIPLRRPPGQPERMSMIKVSNIMGIEPKPFDPKSYVEEDAFVTDESGKKHIRLEDNIVRWRKVKNPDGTTSIESNARFVKWSDGSMQLLIGNEVLDTTVQEAHHDQSHIFLRHGKGILQSQGRLSTKMRFMPSSITSKSHRVLTALVDSCHKKAHKVKNCITDIDPEKEKEKGKFERKTIRAGEILHRKREKLNRKYTQTYCREWQHSPGYVDDGSEEEDEPDDYSSSRRSSAQHRFEEDLEAQAKKYNKGKMLNVKKNVLRKTCLQAARLSKRFADSESEREEPEYETDGKDMERSRTRKKDDLLEDEYKGKEEDKESVDLSDEKKEEPKQKKKTGGSSLQRKVIDSDEDSPPVKAATHRRKAVVFDGDED